jgi:hypothetical protein
MSKLKPGDKVYRVIDDPEGGWYIFGVEVVTASDRRIQLARPFPFHESVRFSPHSLEIFFFRTPQGAVQRFVKDAESQIESANRKIEDAGKAIRWARSILRNVEATKTP